MKSASFSPIPTLFALFALFSLSGMSSHRPPATDPSLAAYSILQGYTSDASIQLNVLAPSDEVRLIRLRDASDLHLLPAHHERFRVPTEPYEIHRLNFRPQGDARPPFTLEVLDASGKVRDTRTVGAPLREEGGFKIALISCLDHGRSEQGAELWKQLVEDRPDAIFSLGDNVYVDNDENGNHDVAVTERWFWKRYVEARNALWIYRSPRLIPFISTWDDHDYGSNDGGRSYGLKSHSQKVFDVFGAQDPESASFVAGPGVSRALHAYGQTFIFLDDRNFRTDNFSRDPAQTLWGREQESWLFDRLERSKGTAWLLNGTQFFGSYFPFGESHEKTHPENLKALLSRLRGAPVPVIFGSGDRHYTELMEIPEDILGYRTYEITSSAVQSKPPFLSPWILFPNPRKLDGVGTRNNYVIVEKSGTNLKISAIGAGRETFFEKSLRMPELRSKAARTSDRAP